MMVAVSRTLRPAHMSCERVGLVAPEAGHRDTASPCPSHHRNLSRPNTRRPSGVRSYGRNPPLPGRHRGPRTRTNTSAKQQLVSPATRFDAYEMNATDWPSAEIAG